MSDPKQVPPSHLPVIPVNEKLASLTCPMDFNDEGNLLQFVRKNRWLSFDVGGVKVCRLNWVVTVLAVSLLWGFIIAVLASESEGETNPTLEEFQSWQTWITQNCTWLYIVTQNIWIIFLLYLSASKYGSLKLGKPNEKPEFNDLTWFAMLFACGMGVGLYFFGVSEPLSYYRSGNANRLYKPGFFNDDSRAQQAILVTFFHWGLHGWIPYIVVALLLGFVSYRWNMPMTMRNAFFPILGNTIYGAAGDFIDAISMACTTFGVCTSLGFGVKSINSGLYRLNNMPIPLDTLEREVWIIWGITLIATASVLSGLHAGIKILSQVTFGIGVFLLLLLILQDNTWYILNVFVQSLGHYFQYLMQIAFETDAWQQLSIEFRRHNNLLWGSGPEKLLDTLESVVGKEVQDPVSFYNEHPAEWIDGWTVFYWGWWISWSPFVGMFIAMVSRGRTVREVVVGAMMAPVLFSFFWLATFGALAIKMERSVEVALNAVVDVDLGKVDCSQLGYHENIPVSPEAIALAQVGQYALACRSSNDRIYDVVEAYGENIGPFMKFLVVVGVALYFVTSSDSGSYVDDTLAAGGMQKAPVFQKAFWCLTEGACACALIIGGGGHALSALRAVSICAGLPYTVAICFMCSALLRACKYEMGDPDMLTMTRFNTGLFDFTEGFCPTNPPPSAPPLSARVTSLCRALFLPFYEVMPALLGLFSKGNAHVHAAASFSCFSAWILLLALQGTGENLPPLAWTFYLFFVAHLGWIRTETRNKFNIYGSIWEDVCACLFLYPFVVSQLVIHHVNPPAASATDDSKPGQGLSSMNTMHAEAL